MPRVIPSLLLDHLRQPATTTCTLIKIEPVQVGYPTYGVTTLDRNIIYDDGEGELEYLAAIGAQLSTFASSADMAVDGAEVMSLMPEFDIPVSEADLVAGAYDFAKVTAYLVNYEDLSQGHVNVGHGTTGRVKILANGLAFTTEFRGLSEPLRQSLTEKFSLGCRATYGSQPGGPDRYPCMKDVSGDWQAAAVATVGVESNRTLTTAGLTPPYGGVPGMLRWTSGANAGRENEVEAFDDVGGVQTIDLTFPTMFPMQPGDTFEFRDDCSKTEAACKERDNYQWYRGEPKIPVADAGQIAVPGASAGVGTGASTSTEYQAE